MHTVAREEGEGMETTDSESVSSAGTHIQSLEQLLSSPDTKLGRCNRSSETRKPPKLNTKPITSFIPEKSQ